MFFFLNMSTECGLLLFFLASSTTSTAEEIAVIAGSAIDAFCPLREGNLTFQMPSENGTRNLDIQGGHLHIPEARLEHNGSIFCSNGRKRVFVKRLHVIRKRLSKSFLFLKRSTVSSC